MRKQPGRGEVVCGDDRAGVHERRMVPTRLVAVACAAHCLVRPRLDSRGTGARICVPRHALQLHQPGILVLLVTMREEAVIEDQVEVIVGVFERRLAALLELGRPAGSRSNSGCARSRSRSRSRARRRCWRPARPSTRAGVRCPRPNGDETSRNLGLSVAKDPSYQVETREQVRQSGTHRGRPTLAHSLRQQSARSSR